MASTSSPRAATPSPACPTATLSSSTSTTPRSKPGRRRHQPLRIRMSFAVLAIFAGLSCAAFAQRDALPAQITAPPSLDSASSVSVADRPAATMAIAPSVWQSATDGAAQELRLKGRDGGEEAPPKDQTTTKDGSDSETKASQTTLTISLGQSTSTAEATQSPLPSPFDDSLPSDFKGTNSDDRCPNFMTSLLANPTFKSCYPLSMMIQTSRGLFNAEKKLLSIVRVLDTTCKADVASCTDFLSKAAQNLTADANCKAELDQGQSLVLQAWRGLKSYKMLYSVTCLQDPSTNMYCFANAVTNITTPSDSYLYFMPYGLALPGASMPTCNWCTQETMAIYHTASADRQQFVASKYEDAARQVNTICGPGFVNATLPQAAAAASVAVLPSYVVTLAAMVVILGTFL
ncbi:hypothetical protein TOPH_00537 [Tolypocladium ophioglossoides CBS 100239]|uniref:DUF7729 domain-containing protein n=1 Tax=Tolypocladium ophioglossoides (strain CBS 100239) TaxID=1163406 RepID=A0A0L0NLF6_TOLOC|nr:hypothetical protein TOPH_00537 [Tolypocladium ophioglossoides CBS 100239]